MEGIWRISYNNGTNGITLSNDLFKFLKQPQTYVVVLYLTELCSWYMLGALHHSSNCLEYAITSLFKPRTQKILAQIFHPKKFPEWKISNPKILWSSLSLFEVTELKLWSSPPPPPTPGLSRTTCSRWLSLHCIRRQIDLENGQKWAWGWVILCGQH